jgi:hypothetical protein
MLAKHALSQLSYGPVVETTPAFALTGSGVAAFARFATMERSWLARPKLAKRAKAGGPGKT